MPITLDVNVQIKMGQIGIQQTPANMQVHTPKTQFDLQQIPPPFELIITPPDMHISQQPSRNDIGFQDYQTFMRTKIAEAYQAAGAGIERRVSEGDQMGHIENKGSPSPAQLSYQTAFNDGPQSFNVDCAPKIPPDIDATLGTVKVQAGFPQVKTNAVVPPVQIKTELGQVRVYLEQQPSLTIHVGGSIDIQT